MDFHGLGRCARLAVILLFTVGIPAFPQDLPAADQSRTGAAASAPASSDWSASAVGARVRLKTTAIERTGGQVSLTGVLSEIDQDDLLISRENRPTVRVPRGSVTSLEVSRGRSSGRGALIGAGIGALGGLALGAYSYSQCEGMLCGAAFFLPVLTAPIGAVVGAIVGQERWVRSPMSKVAFGVVPVPHGFRVGGTVAF